MKTKQLKKHIKNLGKDWKDWVVDGAIVLLVLGFITAGGLLVFISTLDLPDLSAFEQRRVHQSTKNNDRTGEIVHYVLNQDVRCTVIPYDEISHHINNATAAIEDDTFFSHWGIRPLRIAKAVIDNISTGDLLGGQGGS